MATVEERLARAKANSPKTYAMLNGTPVTPANTVSAPVNKSFQVQGNIYTDKNVPKEVGQMVANNNTITNNNYANDINKLTQAQTAKAIMDLENRRNSVLSSLNQEKSQIEPKYQQAKMQANTTSQLGARNFAEFMAQRGLTNSGVNAQAEINRVGTLQRNINNLTTEENEKYADIARRTTDANTSYASDVASASMGIEADKLKMLMDAKAKAEETAYARSRDALADKRYDDTTTYNRGRDTVEDSRYNNEFSLKKREFELQEERMTQEAEIRRWEFEAQKALQPQEKLLADLKVDEARKKLAQLDIELKYLPQKYQADISATNRSNTGGGGGGSVKKSTYFETSAKAVSDRFAQINNRQGNASAYIKKPGSIEYNELFNLIKSMPITDDEKNLLGNQYLK